MSEQQRLSPGIATPQPCPCCDSPSTHACEEDVWHLVRCTNRKCGLQSGIFPTKPMAFKAWNARTGGSAQAESMARLSASEVACYRWPEQTAEHRAMRAAFCDGAALSAVTPSPVAVDRYAVDDPWCRPVGKTWTPDQFWEYVGGLAGEFDAGQIRDMLASKGLSLSSTTRGTPKIVGRVTGIEYDGDQVPGMPGAICHACGLKSYPCTNPDCPKGSEIPPAHREIGA